MITFSNADIQFKFNKKRAVKDWIKATILEENKKTGDISVIFCSDPYILDMNRQYLGHDYYTDVITFDYVEGDRISGDIFISIDTVEANSKEYGAASFEEEMLRVIIHGVLHLLEYDDHTEEDIARMRQAENDRLQAFKAMTDGKQ